MAGTGYVDVHAVDGSASGSIDQNEASLVNAHDSRLSSSAPRRPARPVADATVGVAEAGAGADRFPAWAVVVGCVALATLLVVAKVALRLEDGAGVLVLLVLPISLLALRFGVRGGVLGALTAILLLGLPPTMSAPGPGLLGYLTRSLTFVVLGVLVGHLSDQARRFRVTLERRVASAGALVAAATGVLTDEGAQRHAAERELEQERDFLAAVLESLDEGIVACDGQGNLSFFNEATRRLHGLPLLPIPAAEWADHYDLYLSDGTTPMPCEEIPLMRVFAGETVRDVPMVVAPPGAQPRTVMATGRPLVARSGAPVGAVVAMRDVTDQLRLQRELQSTAAEAMARLARAVEYRDTETGAHVERMSQGCRLLAERLGLPPERCAMIETASRLHDIGKVGVPDAVLLKRGKLDAEEWALMEKHTVTGHELLAGSGNDVLDLAAVIALSHHERVDGTGYPHGLRGAAIPIEGRIAAIADAFDALTSDRPYRAAFAPLDALEMMARERDTHFDADLLDLFVEVQAAGECLDFQADAVTQSGVVAAQPAVPAPDQAVRVRDCLAEAAADLHDHLVGLHDNPPAEREGFNADIYTNGLPGRGCRDRQSARDRRWADDDLVRAAAAPRSNGLG